MKNFFALYFLFCATIVYSQCPWYANAIPAGVCGPNTLIIDVNISQLNSSASAWSLYIQTDEFITQDVLFYDTFEAGEHRIFVEVPNYVINSQPDIYAIFSDAPSPGMGFCQENSIPISLGCLSDPNYCGEPSWGEINDIQAATCEDAADGSFQIPKPWNSFCGDVADGDAIVIFNPTVDGWECDDWGPNLRFSNLPAGEYTVNIQQNQGGILGCSNTYTVTIPSTGLPNLGFSLDEVVHPRCENTPYSDDTNYTGLMLVERDSDSNEGLTFLIYDPETNETREPIQVNSGPGYAYVYGFDAGTQCLRIYEEGTSCPQEFCVEFDYEIYTQDVQYEILAYPEFFGDNFQVQFYIEPDYNMFWGIEGTSSGLQGTGQDVATFLIEDGEYIYLEAHAWGTYDATCDMNTENVPNVFEYLPGFELTYFPTMCNESANGKVIFQADVGDLPADIILQEVPPNPNLEYELIDGELHIFNLDAELHCYEVNSVLDPSVNQEFCVLNDVMYPPTLPSFGNVVIDPTCGNAFDGGRRVAVNDLFNAESLLEFEFTSYLPELDIYHEPYLEQISNYSFWLMGLGEGLNEVTGTHPNGCTLNWNITMDESGSGTLTDVLHEVLSISEDGIIVSIELDVIGGSTWDYTILSEATQLQDNEFLIPLNTNIIVESCPAGFSDICCDSRIINLDYIFACTDENACNYSPEALADDNSCEYSSCAGCMNNQAENYNPSATIDDGSCIFPPLLGDFDNNNAVDSNDLLQFLMNYGAEGIGAPEDLNQDGIVNAADLLVFLNIFGSSY